MLQLKSIKITNFRAIKSAKVNLDPNLTILVGENSTGKTAILDAIAASLSMLPINSPARPSTKVEAKDFRASGQADPIGEVAQEREISLLVSSDIGEWKGSFELLDHTKGPTIRGSFSGEALKNFSDLQKDENGTLPIIASYGADRAMPPRRSPSATAFHRRIVGSLGRGGGYLGSLDSRAVYEEAIDWFEAIENLELRNSRELGSYRDPRLEAVRSAVSKLVPDVSNLRMVGLPPRLLMDTRLPGRQLESLSVDQLSGGYRAMLALVIDLARRMADLNPETVSPLESDGIVLIDEIDLHLHPKWQQLVVSGLRKTFPKVQFIISTHSPQVLTTVESRNIRKLRWVDGCLIQDDVPSTSGAESGRLMTEVMDVAERPPKNISKFVEILDQYRDLVLQGKWHTKEAALLLEKLKDISPDDPVHGVLDLEQRRLSSQARRKSL